jgi:hypothetical protein
VSSGAIATRKFPTLKLYKIGVRFDVGGEGRPDDASRETAEHAFPTEHDETVRRREKRTLAGVTVHPAGAGG